MAIPKYQHIKDELKQPNYLGKFENGMKFYAEAELIKIYDVSSITWIVRALNDLAADVTLSASKEKEPLFLDAPRTQMVEFSDVETFPIQRPKSKFSLLNIKEIP